MSTTAPTNDFLLQSAKKQLGFKPTAQVSLNGIDSIVPHQRYLSEKLALMTSLSLFNPPNLSSAVGVDRIGRCPESILKSWRGFWESILTRSMYVIPRVCWIPNMPNNLCSLQSKDNRGWAVSFPPFIHFTRRTHHYLLDGYITCLREGCGKRIVSLDSSKYANAQDGGITRGYGAFTAYQVTPYSPKMGASVC